MAETVVVRHEPGDEITVHLGEEDLEALTGGPPTGGATAAKQDTGNTTLASILAKIVAAPTPIPPSSAEFTRQTGNTTPYSNKDVIGPAVAAALTFSNILGAGVLGGSGYIAKARVMTTQKTSLAFLRLHLFHTIPTAIADNDPYTLLWVNRDKRIGAIDFQAMTSEDATNSTAAYTIWTGPPLHFKCAAADSSIYGVLQNLVANYTPDDGQQFFVELSADRTA